MDTPHQKEPHRILIVDDEHDITDLFAELMREMGYDVRCANDGKEALEVIGSYNPDVIVSDIHMPSLDGDQLYREAVRLTPSYARKFVFITGNELDDKLRTFLAETKCAIVLKPFRLQQLTSVINTKIDENEG